MQFRFWYILAAFAIIYGVFYISNSPSYTKSLEAKYFYYIKDYEKAQKLATDSFNLDKYNRMASTIMTQSQVAIQFTNYVKDAKKYMDSINELSKKESITKAEKARIKMMCEVMIDSYVKIPSTVVIDSSLKDEASYYYEQFKKLYEEITPKT